MKQIILSMVAFLILSTSFAQEEVNYFQKKNEINIQVDDIFAKQDLLYNYYYWYIDGDLEYYYPYYEMNAPSVGIGYKHHFGKSAVRIKGSFSLMARTYKPEEDNDDNNSTIASYHERISAGYEWQHHMKRTQIFFGIDATLGFQTYIVKQKVAQYIGPYDEYQYIDSKSVSASFLYGAAPFIGFRYFISPLFSVSTEYHLLLEGYTTRNKTEIDGEENENIPKTTGFRSKFGPKGQITFSYHF